MKTFFFREHHDFGTKIGKFENLRKIYFVPQKIFLAGPPMSVRNSAYSNVATLLLTNVPIHHFENMATLHKSKLSNKVKIQVATVVFARKQTCFELKKTLRGYFDTSEHTLNLLAFLLVIMNIFHLIELNYLESFPSAHRFKIEP